ncbi:MAG: hypothetical protein QXX42_00905 [Thermoplasmatales archaeon]
MPDYGERLVYKDRIENIKNAVSTFRDYGITPALMALYIGFGENNRKLIFGSKAKIAKGTFEYENPYSKGGY